MHDICRELEEISELCRSAAEKRDPEAAAQLREAIERIEKARAILAKEPGPLRSVQ